MALARVNASCDEHDVEIARRQRERRWQRGVAATRSHSLKRAAMARVPLSMTTSDWALATEDIGLHRIRLRLLYTLVPQYFQIH